MSTSVPYEARLQGETAEYRAARAELQAAEIALRDQREKVAAMRRALPRDTPIHDYELHAEGGETRRLSELFGERDTLVLMHFMFGKAQQQPCPMCTLWADGYSGIAHHLQQRVAFGVVVADQLDRFAGYAAERGWDDLLLYSAEGSTFKQDLKTELPNGQQLPAVSVFTRADDGTVHHFYTGSAMFGGGEFRGLDLLSPMWHFLDLTPAGRGDWMPSTEYEQASSESEE